MHVRLEFIEHFGVGPVVPELGQAVRFDPDARKLRVVVSGVPALQSDSDESVALTECNAHVGVVARVCEPPLQDGVELDGADGLYRHRIVAFVVARHGIAEATGCRAKSRDRRASLHHGPSRPLCIARHRF